MTTAKSEAAKAKRVASKIEAVVMHPAAICTRLGMPEKPAVDGGHHAD